MCVAGVYDTLRAVCWLGYRRARIVLHLKLYCTGLLSGLLTGQADRGAPPPCQSPSIHPLRTFPPDAVVGVLVELIDRPVAEPADEIGEHAQRELAVLRCRVKRTSEAAR